MPLSKDQRDGYERDGYLLCRELIDRDTLVRLEDRFLALVSGEVAAHENTIIMRDVAFASGRAEPKSPLHAVNKLMSFEDDEVLWPFARDPRLLDVVHEVIGSELMTLSTNVFNKPPGVDGRHPLHQDLRYFALRPADAIMASWTAIKPCTRESGCLAVIPGSHRAGLHEHASPDWDEVNFGFFGAQGVDASARIHVEMEPGDTLFFHPLLVHGSGSNRSADFRRAISIHYASVECRRPDEMTGRRPATRRIGSAIRRLPSS